MTHLSLDELKTWYAHGASTDRERVIDHLAECAECRKALALMAIDDQSAPVPVVTAAEAAPHGYAAGKALEPAGGVPRWMHSPWVRLGGALAVVALVFWITTPTVNQRRNIPTMVAGESGTGQEFRWESPFPAARYRVTVRDQQGVLMFTGEVTAPLFRPNDTMRSQLKPGESYTWIVESLDASGGIVAHSVPVTFRYQP